MKLHHVKKILKRGHIKVKKFKTMQFYFCQPITSDRLVVVSLLKIFLKVIHPVLIQIDSVFSSPKHNVFSTYDGRRMDSSSIGRLYTSFYTKSICIHLTTSMTRAMVETAAEDAEKKGLISRAERESVHTVNGHSSTMSEEFYEFQDSERAVQLSQKVFDLSSRELEQSGMQRLHFDDEEDDDEEIGYSHDVDYDVDNYDDYDHDSGYGSGSTSIFTSPTSESNVHISIPHACHPSPEPRRPKPTVSEFIEWGRDHPSYNVVGAQKVKWSDEEIDYIGRKIAHMRERNTFNYKSRFSQMLQDILTDPTAYPIFHSQHIADSTKIRNGFEAYERKSHQKILQY